MKRAKLQLFFHLNGFFFLFLLIWINFAPKYCTKMKRLILFFAVLGVLASCGTANQNAATVQDLHPDQVFTVTEDDIALETRQINEALRGEWTYKGPSVDVSGRNVLSGLGKPIAKGKLKSKLKKAFKKIGLYKARPQFTFNVDGTCTISMLGVRLKGTYNYNPSTEKITFKWHGVPLSANLKRDGKNKLHLTFDTDKLLSLFKLLSSVSDNSTLKALAFLTDHYDDVMVGFELKK